MRFVNMSAGALAVASLMVAPAYAGQRGQSGAHGPSAGPKAPTATTHGPTSTHGPTATRGPAATSHGPTTTAHGPTTKTTGPAGGPKSTKSGGSPQTAKGKASTTTTTTTAAAASNSTTTAAPSTKTAPTTVDFTSGKAGQLLTKNTALRSKLETRLQTLGYEGSVYQAAYGFKNVGQFVAATNVSQNLSIPFEQLKLQMTGLSVSPDGVVLQATRLPDGTVTLVDPATATSPAPTSSLGQSIQTFKSDVDATTTAQTATRTADAEIASTTSATTSTTTTARRNEKKSTR
jgi:hypothetical protein